MYILQDIRHWWLSVRLLIRISNRNMSNKCTLRCFRCQEEYRRRRRQSNSMSSDTASTWPFTYCMKGHWRKIFIWRATTYRINWRKLATRRFLHWWSLRLHDKKKKKNTTSPEKNPWANKPVYNQWLYIYIHIYISKWANEQMSKWSVPIDHIFRSFWTTTQKGHITLKYRIWYKTEMITNYYNRKI